MRVHKYLLIRHHALKRREIQGHLAVCYTRDATTRGLIDIVWTAWIATAAIADLDLFVTALPWFIVTRNDSLPLQAA